MRGEIAASCLTYVGVFDNFLICGHPPPPVEENYPEDGLPIEGRGPVPFQAYPTLLPYHNAQGHYHFTI